MKRLYTNKNVLVGTFSNYKEFSTLIDNYFATKKKPLFFRYITYMTQPHSVYRTKIVYGSTTQWLYVPGKYEWLLNTLFCKRKKWTRRKKDEEEGGNQRRKKRWGVNQKSKIDFKRECSFIFR